MARTVLTSVWLAGLVGQESGGDTEEGVPPEQHEDDGMESGFAALEMCTLDDTEPAPADVLEQLGEAAEGLGGDEAEQLGQWLSARLGVEAIPVVLKTLQLVGLMLDAAESASNKDVRTAFAKHCEAPVRAALSFDQVDPQHGDRPAQLIRKTARTVLGKLGEDAGDSAASDAPADGVPPRGTVVGLYGDQSADDLFEQALQRRRQKATGGAAAAAAEEKKPEVKAKLRQLTWEPESMWRNK